MSSKRAARRIKVLVASLGLAAMLVAGLPSTPVDAVTGQPSMAFGVGDWEVEPIFTVGETVTGYTPPGVLDGLGAYELDGNTVRVLANHELLHFRGYPYSVANGFSMTGARISYFDIDKTTKEVVASGLAVWPSPWVANRAATTTSGCGCPSARRSGPRANSPSG